MKKTLSAAIVAAALTLTAACGGGGGDRPTTDEISKALTGKNSVFGTAVPKKTADCIAKVFEESELSDKTLNAIVEGKKDYENKDDEKKLTGLSKDLTKCASAA